MADAIDSNIKITLIEWIHKKSEICQVEQNRASMMYNIVK